MNEKIKKIIEEIESLNILELNKLIKALEEKFGAPSMVFAPQAAPTETKKEEKASVNVVLTEAGANKIQVIKALREINPSLGLKEAKDIVDNLPKVIKENVKPEEADKIKSLLENAGAKVEIQ